MAEQQRPPYPPAPPYPQGPIQGPGTMPRPLGTPPAMGGMPAQHMPGMKMPVGMKVPPRPMGYPMPPGMKVPVRPGGIPPVAMPPGVPATAVPAYYPPEAEPTAPEPISAEEEVDALWGAEDAEQEAETEQQEDQQLEVDENGFIDDLASEEEEVPAEPEQEEESLFEPSPYEHNMASDLGLPPAFIKTKVLLPLFLFFIICGGVMGFVINSMQNRSDAEMPGVVYNSEIPKGRPRCGLAQKGQGCVLYLMNAQRREVEAKDFFTMASDILGVPKFQIETANIRYATMRIPPGYIALLNIPPM